MQKRACQGSKQRRSAQTALYYILERIVKLIAPILSFTAEEVLFSFPLGDKKKESIYLYEFDENLYPSYRNEEILKKWERILSLREKVLKEIERKREEKIIGSSLEAEVILFFEDEDYKFYKNCEEILREAFIVSKVEIKKGKFLIQINKAKGKKCLRCWNYKEDVGKDKEFPYLCSRCILIIKSRKEE